ncbi:MAG TPA: hypothetical protein VF335_06970, partial [Chitinivibrionales bacterium]
MRMVTHGAAPIGLMVVALISLSFGVNTWTVFKQLGAGEHVQVFNQDDSVLWVGTNKALYTTTAANQTWKQIKTGNVHAIDIEESFSCVGMDSSLVVLSLSKQELHTYALTRGAGVINSVIAYSDSDIVVGTNTGVYERYLLAGGSVSWDTLLTGEIVNSVVGINDFLFVGCESGLYETNFSDTGWTVLSNLPARSLALSDSGFFVLADSSFWYYSLNALSNGYRFDSIPPAPLPRGSISGFSLSWKTKFCAVKNRGVYWSPSGQNTLFPLDTAHLIDKSVVALYSLDLSTSTLFAATSSGALYTFPIDSLILLAEPIKDQPGAYVTSGLKNRLWHKPFWVHESLLFPVNWPVSENIHAIIVNAAGCKLCEFRFPVMRGYQTITLGRVNISKGMYCI